MGALSRVLHRAATTAQRGRLAALRFADEGHGYDAFGLHPSGVALGMALTEGLYRAWFRVTSSGHRNIPASGPAILAANHSGTLPFDALMLWADVVRKTEPPRLARPVADHFVVNLPFLSELFSRGGAVGGSRKNLERLLERGELVALFPEGVPGIGKRFRERYTLKPWRVGHAELAMRHRAPVVPVAIVGAEEQMPELARIPLDGVELFGAPYLPIPLTPLPLPVHYHIYYGDPLVLHERFDPARASEPEVLEEAAAVVASAVRGLIERGLRERKGVFR
jgi:1-acyl-sn-glycerol-3-phosphate acyltransferase